MTRTIYFTIAGMNFRYGRDFAERGMAVTLEKDPANEYDKEAIKVNMPGLGQIGWVANSVGTVLGECYSAGRIYDKIGDTAEATIAYVTQKGCVCEMTVGDECESHDPGEDRAEPREKETVGAEPEDDKADL